MTHHLVIGKQIDEAQIALSEVTDPDRCVDKNHGKDYCLTRLLGMGCIFGALPPKAARRLADSTRINTFNASRNRSDLSTLGSMTSSAWA